MNVTVENLGACERQLRVELDAAKVDETFAAVTRDFQKEAKLPGFRPGKSPLDMVAKRYEAEILDEAKRKLVSESYRQAIADHKLNVVGPPDIDEVEFARGQACKFLVKLEVAPEFELPEYKGLTANRETGGATPEDVERALKMLADREAKYEPVARELKEGDVAVVNYNGSCDGKPISDLAPAARGLTEKKNFWINVDKTSFLPGFGEQLIGLKAGDRKTVNIDFPADFVTPELAGKKGVFEVEVVEAREKHGVEINEEFAKKFDSPSLEKLREGIRADLQNEWNLKQTRSIRGQVVEGFLKQVQCDLPPSMVEEETRDVVYSIVSENQQRGITKEAIDGEKDRIYAVAANTAKERVKAMFVLRRVAEKEGVRVEQADLFRRLQEMAAQYKMPVDKLVKELEKSGGLGGVHGQLLNEKVVDLLVQYAKIQDVAPGTAAAAAPAAS